VYQQIKLANPDSHRKWPLKREKCVHNGSSYSLLSNLENAPFLSHKNYYSKMQCQNW